VRTVFFFLPPRAGPLSFGPTAPLSMLALANFGHRMRQFFFSLFCNSKRFPFWELMAGGVL